VDFLHGIQDLLHGILSGAYTMDMLIQWGGYILLVGIVFAETGLLVGFFLPGDSLLITAGLLAGLGKLDIWLLNALVMAAAIVGDSTGYAIGESLGPRIFTRPKSLLFNPKHVARTQRFYEKYGAKTIVIARFVPIIRTFAPVLAGVGQMRYRRFVTYNVAGGIGWVASMTWAGYLLGQTVPNISKNIHVLVIVIIILSVIPIAVEIYRERRKTFRRL
jgi:membrane-associated protein